MMGEDTTVMDGRTERLCVNIDGIAGQPSPFLTLFNQFARSSLTHPFSPSTAAGQSLIKDVTP